MDAEADGLTRWLRVSKGGALGMLGARASLSCCGLGAGR